MFVLDCSRDPDKQHQLCREYGPKALMHGSLSSRSAAIIDLDNDGDLDIVSNEMNDRPLLLLSDLSDNKKIHFLKIRLVGSGSNRDALGATVKVKAGSLNLLRYNDGKSGYLAQSLSPLYFGLADVDGATSIEVIWPNGKNQRISENIPKNGLLTIREQ
jgi:enediyne biosynthesis protein E4